MKSVEYIPLNSWLQNSDSLYIEGRILWFHMGIAGSCILLWLALEQLMKTLTFQKTLEIGEISYDKAENTFKALDKWGKKTSHKLEPNIQLFNRYYPGVINEKDTKTLKKINDYFDMRYVKNISTSIEMKLLYDVDELYFKFRDLISHDLPLAIMEEVDLGRNGKYPFTITDYKEYALLENTSFRPRSKYRE